ncbi:MAG: peptide chain release factor N(5)-glutamine methyltransferase [Phycisphaerales bacterium JB043]
MTTAPAHSKTWTTRHLLDWIREALERAGVDSPRLSAEILVSHVLGCERLALYTHADRPASTDERDRLRGLVRRALDHEPVQYLTQRAWFFSMEFHVDTRVLVPRPSTETLVEIALEHARSLDHPPLIADVCTGSGCVALALLRHLPEARALATDIDPDAIDVACLNAQRLELDDRFELRQGDALTALNGEHVDILVANPPYIPDHEWDDVGPTVKSHEPTHALRGGPDGLDVVRPIIEGAAGVLRPGGFLGIEVASCHAQQALELLAQSGAFADCAIHKDIDALDRVVSALRHSA